MVKAVADMMVKSNSKAQAHHRKADEGSAPEASHSVSVAQVIAKTAKETGIGTHVDKVV